MIRTWWNILEVIIEMKHCGYVEGERRKESEYLITPQIVMEYCGGGSVADLIQIMECGLNEDEIAIICKEALQVHFFFIIFRMHIVI